MVHSFAFEVKQITDEGRFTGLASTYDSVDLVGDLIERHAFDRTLQAGAERPLLWMHSAPIGLVKLRDSADGLIADGKLSLGIQQAKDALVLLRDRVVKGLSIGFSVVKERSDGAVRRLLEVKLWEVSLTPIPANEMAMVTSVKSMRIDEIARAAQELRDFYKSITGSNYHA